MVTTSVGRYSHWPKAIEINRKPNNSFDGYRVKVRILSPEILKIAHTIANIYAVAYITIAIMFHRKIIDYFGQENLSWLGWIVIFLVVSYLLMRFLLLPEILKKTILVEFIGNMHVKVSGIAGLAKSYETRYINAFVCKEHHKSADEERKEKEAQHKSQLKGGKRLIRKKKYYRKSSVIEMHYSNVPLKVASVHNKGKAEKIYRRLQALLEDAKANGKNWSRAKSP